VLAVRALSRRDAFADISLEIRPGQILGLAGLIGSGAKELMRCLFGDLKPDRGEIRLSGRAARLRGPGGAIRRSIALVPEDRRRQGIAPALSVRENTTLASLDRISRFGFLNPRAERRVVDGLIRRLAIRTPGRDAPVRQLSGGNQQKVVLAKWLGRGASVYLLDEPTVGVDIAAKVEIYRTIADLAAAGAAILVLSADLLELTGLADRILVLYRGRVVADLPAADTTEDTLLALATTGTEAGRHAA
jgi:ribose transport system ATP-binding protein